MTELRPGARSPDEIPCIRPASPALERFARQTLGCHCPAEVFEQVEERCGAAPGLPGVYRRIALGGRLLIYMAETPVGEDAVSWVLARLGTWVAAGLAERDERRMNRLRIVVGLDDPTREWALAIETAFSQLPDLAGAGPDPRVHLHSLPRSSLAGL